MTEAVWGSARAGDVRGWASSKRSARLPGRGSIAGLFHRRRCAFTCASAWRTASACSGCRFPGRSASSKSIACPADMSFFGRMFSTTCDWRISELGWMFTLFFVFLGRVPQPFGEAGSSAPGPRKAGFVAALCWCGGLVFSAAGVYLHQIWMLWLGSGIIGGIGLGLGLHLAGFDADQVVSRTAAAWRPAWRSWVSAAAR